MNEFEVGKAIGGAIEKNNQEVVQPVRNLANAQGQLLTYVCKKLDIDIDQAFKEMQDEHDAQKNGNPAPTTTKRRMGTTKGSAKKRSTTRK